MLRMACKSTSAHSSLQEHEVKRLTWSCARGSLKVMTEDKRVVLLGEMLKYAIGNIEIAYSEGTTALRARLLLGHSCARWPTIRIVKQCAAPMHMPVAKLVFPAQP